MRKLIVCIVLACFLPLHVLLAQSQPLGLNGEASRLLQHYELQSGRNAFFFAGNHPFQRQDAAEFAIGILKDSTLTLNRKDSTNLQYILDDCNDWLVPRQRRLGMKKLKGANWQDSLATVANPNETSPYYRASRRPILKHLYRTPAQFFEVNHPSFYLVVNPILHLEAGIEQTGDSSRINFYNRRGIELRGGIDNRIWFYTNILETQAQFPNHVVERIVRDRAVPGAGKYKNYDTQFTENTKDGYDFLLAQGHIGFRASNHVAVELGHGTNFIGDGYRSLFLSDFAPNYFYLKINTRVWKLHYQNLFAELTGDRTRPGDYLYDKKYLVAHHLSLQASKRLTLGIYEAVLFDRDNGFELQYLNPIILYRAVEGALGSPDNVLLGLNARYIPTKNVGLYGQLLLDEFKFSELIVERRGWWANKFGLQFGGRYANAFGIRNLDLQAEYNLVRPYTYSHRDSSANYTHHNQPLAHPFGANFGEAVFRLNWQPLSRLQLRGQINYASVGLDSLGSNWGSNPLLTSESRMQDYDNTIGQGVGATLTYVYGSLSYQIRHQLFLYGEAWLRRMDAAVNSYDRTAAYLGLGIRWNMADREHDF